MALRAPGEGGGTPRRRRREKGGGARKGRREIYNKAEGLKFRRKAGTNRCGTRKRGEGEGRVGGEEEGVGEQRRWSEKRRWREKRGAVMNLTHYDRVENDTSHQQQQDAGGLRVVA